MSLCAEDADAVLRHFRLGTASDVAPLLGGMSNESWRVRTTGGAAYVLKRLVAHTTRPEHGAELARAWAIESRMFAAGVSMPRPVPDPLTGRGHARIVGLGSFRVHELVPGEPVARYAAEPRVVAAAGGLLASVHLAALPAAPQYPDLAGFGWHEATRNLLDVDSVRGSAVAQALPAVEALSLEVAGTRLVPRPTVGTHRDVDPKNVLRRPDGRLVLVDWDVAADADPHHELTTAALDWGGAVSGRFDPETAGAFLDGYRSAGGPAEVVQDGVGIWLLQYLRWFEHGVRQLAKAAAAQRQPASAGAADLELPAGVAAGVVDWGCRWARQTRDDLPGLRRWVGSQCTRGRAGGSAAYFTSARAGR